MKTNIIWLAGTEYGAGRRISYRQPHLLLRVTYSFLCYLEITFVNLNPDKVTPRLHTRHAGCARPHERVEDGAVSYTHLTLPTIYSV